MNNINKVDTINLKCSDDIIHFSANSQVVLGEMFAGAYFNLISEKNPLSTIMNKENLN